MAKKYLLYIHPVEFETEKHKSRLVNELLDRYYAEKPGAVKRAIKSSNTQFKPGKIIKTAADVPKNLCPHGNKYGACLEVKCLTAYRMGVR